MRRTMKLYASGNGRLPLETTLILFIQDSSWIWLFVEAEAIKKVVKN